MGNKANEEKVFHKGRKRQKAKADQAWRKEKRIAGVRFFHNAEVSLN